VTRVKEHGEFKVYFDERGEPVKVEYRGETYDVEAESVAMPLSEVADLKLRDIPPEVSIEPLKARAGSHIQPIQYSSLEYMDYTIYIGNNGAAINAYILFEEEEERTPPSHQYAKALEDLAKTLKKAGTLKRVDTWLNSDSYAVYLEAPAHPDKTIGEAVETIKKAIRSLEEAARLKALGKPHGEELKEAEKHLRQLATK